MQNEPLRQQQERESTLTELARTRQALADTRKAVDHLEQAARREGALPGWLRD